MSKKLVIVTLLAVLAIGVSVAQATVSRLDTLGQNTGLVYIQDDTNIFTNPAALANYPNCLIFHMAGVSGDDKYAAGGVSLALGKMLTLGIIVGRNPGFEEYGLLGSLIGTALSSAPGTLGTSASTAMMAPISFTNPWGAYSYTNTVGGIAGYPNGAMNWVNPIDLILAAKVGNLKLGLSWYYAGGKQEDTQENDVASYSDELTGRLQAWKFGVATTMGNMSPELWFQYAPFSVKSKFEEASGPLTEETRYLKAHRFNIGFRVPYKMNEKITLVPAFEYSNVGGNIKFDATPDFNPTSVAGLTEGDLSDKYTGNAINVGVGINYQIEKLLVASSIGLQWASAKETLSVNGLDGDVNWQSKWFAIPVVGLGLEYQATKVLVFRGGLSTTTLYGKATGSYNASVAGAANSKDEVKVSQQNTTASVGLGFLFGNLVIDVTAGNMILANEPGNDGHGNNSLFSALDFKYKF